MSQVLVPPSDLAYLPLRYEHAYGNMDPLNNQEMLLALQQSLIKKRVLIIDRHTQSRDSLRMMLSNLGVTSVRGAGTAAEVIRQVHSRSFDIVLSDLILDDGRDGQQLLEELRHANLISPATVYIIITGERSFSNVVSLAELAPDDYLIKPFTGDQLQSRLVRAIYRKHVLQKIYRNMGKGHLKDAITACDNVIRQHPNYLYDALRFKGELLQSLGRLEEAEAVYRQALANRAAPWAKMGLAAVLKERNVLEESEKLAQQVIEETPRYLAAYDFLASVLEAQGRLPEAQDMLMRALETSPNNTTRQRLVGDIALRNRDLPVAEKAYGKALERQQGSSLKTVDDIANLSRVLVERGNFDGARKILTDLRRDRRGDKQTELAALVLESLCLQGEGAADKTAPLLDQALALWEDLREEMDAVPGKSLSPRLSVDLAHASYAGGKAEAAQQIMRQVAGENNEDGHLISHITHVFEKVGQAETGKALLDEVGAEISRLGNDTLDLDAANLDESVQKLCQAADRVPNLLILVNAAMGIFTLLDRVGWDQDLAERGHRYLQRARQKDSRNPRVAAARELYASVARKYGIGQEEF